MTGTLAAMDTERDDIVRGNAANDTEVADDDAELIEEISIDGMCGVY